MAYLAPTHRNVRRPRPRRKFAFERLEDRLVLAAPPFNASLVVAPAAIAMGQSAVMTATLRSTQLGTELAAGEVDFLDGSSLIGTAQVNGGDASGHTYSAPSPPSLPVGAHTITAIYQSPATLYATSNAAPLTVNAASARAASQTVVSAGAATVFGQAATLTATVTDPARAGTPTGFVFFEEGSVIIGMAPLDPNDHAALQTTALAAGMHNITAVYDGDDAFARSTSASSAAQVVNPAATVVTINPAVNPITVGQTVTITTQVYPSAPGAGVPTGSVNFTEGSSTLGSAPLVNGVATIGLSPGVGAHAILATYVGDSNFATGQSSPITLTVNPVPVTQPGGTLVKPFVFIDRVSAPGRSLEVAVRVSGSSQNRSATGIVLLYESTRFVAALPLIPVGKSNTSISKTQAETLTAVDPGTDSPVTAVYLGDGAFTPASLTTTVADPRLTVTTIIGLSPPEPAPNSSFRATATVLPFDQFTESVVTTPVQNPPSGQVFFYVDGILAGKGTIDGQTAFANISTAGLAVGSTHVLLANYQGDSDHLNAPSAAPGAHFTVKTDDAAVFLSSSPFLSTVNVPMSLTARVTSGTPVSGQVEFFAPDPSHPGQYFSLGPRVTLTNGSATLRDLTPTAQTSKGPVHLVGNLVFKAAYYGDATHQQTYGLATIQIRDKAIVTSDPRIVDVASQSANPGGVIFVEDLVTPIIGGVITSINGEPRDQDNHQQLPTGKVLFYINGGKQFVGSTPVIAGKYRGPVTTFLFDFPYFGSKNIAIDVYYSGDASHQYTYLGRRYFANHN
jgi:hypothetical protein